MAEARYMMVMAFNAALAVTAAPSARSVAGEWPALGGDGLHDPASPAIGLLQEPSDALSVLPPDPAGNKVDWVAALRQGAIQPRTNILPETRVRTRDTDIVFSETADLPLVVFPHLAHTEWLDCENCHERIFKSEIGATSFGMFDILMGNYCGRCHGAVAFPLTECNRCHSRER